MIQIIILNIGTYASFVCLLVPCLAFIFCVIRYRISNTFVIYERDLVNGAFPFFAGIDLMCFASYFTQEEREGTELFFLILSLVMHIFVCVIAVFAYSEKLNRDMKKKEWEGRFTIEPTRVFYNGNGAPKRLFLITAFQAMTDSEKEEYINEHRKKHKLLSPVVAVIILNILYIPCFISLLTLV